MYYTARYTFVLEGEKHKRGSRLWLDDYVAKQLLEKRLIKPCDVKKKDLPKPSALPAAPVSPPKIAKKSGNGNKNRPILGLSSRQTQATE